MDFDNSDRFYEREKVGEDPRYIRCRDEPDFESPRKFLIDKMKYLEDKLDYHGNWTRELKPEGRSEVKFSGKGGTIRASKRDNLIFYESEGDAKGLEKNACLMLAPELYEFYSESSGGMSFRADSPGEVDEVAELLTSLDNILGYSSNFE